MQPNSHSSHYAVLGVAVDATQHEIKRAFRQKSKAVHPDVCKQQDSQELFIQCRTAYDTLSCDQARAAYDDSLSFSALPSLSPTPPAPRASESGCIICDDDEDYECYADGGACAGAYTTQHQPSSSSSDYSSYASTSAYGGSSTGRNPYSNGASSSHFGGGSSPGTPPPRVKPSQGVIDPDLRDTMAGLIREARHWSRKVERNWVGTAAAAPATATAGGSSIRSTTTPPRSPYSTQATRAAQQSSAASAAQRVSRPVTSTRPNIAKASTQSRSGSSASSEGEGLPWIYYNPATAAAAAGRASISTQRAPPHRS
ncbi:MAG: hypothetical protein WDW38_003481 [Sanguina aurantia]